MADRPILFSSAMVRALLEGRKTQTRRVLKPSSNVGNFPMYPAYVNGVRAGDSSPPDYCALDGATTDGSTIYMGNSPYCPGDRLWVRETFWHWMGSESRKTAVYKADGVWIDHGSGWTGKPKGEFLNPPKPAIHMPRWASRLTLTVTDVRVQRLQEISEEDAIAEGVTFERHHGGPDLHACDGIRAVEAYWSLWNSLNAERGFGWDTNPWVVAVTFTVEHRNIDEAA